MKIKIKKIAFGKNENEMSLYVFDKKINLIHGPSNNAKTVLLQLLDYSLGNSNAKHLYFNQISKFANDIEREIFISEYTIEHGGKVLDLIVKLECEPKEMTILTTVYRSGLEIITRTSDSTQLRDLFFDEFSIPRRVFWKNTVVRDRNFDEFHSVFFVMSNMNKEKGYFYDIANTKAAQLNSFISAYAFLMNDTDAVEMLRKTELIENIEQITRRNFLLSELLDSFSVAKNSSKSNQSLDDHKVAIINENSDILSKIDSLKQSISLIDIKISKMSNIEKEIRVAKHYNEVYPDNAINIDNFKAIISIDDPMINLNIPTLLSMKAKKREQVKKLEDILKNNNDAIGRLNKFTDPEVQQYIIKHGKNVIENLNKSENDEIHFKDESEFEELFMSWSAKFKELFESLHLKLESLHPDTFDFLQRGKIKIGSGGMSFLVYLRLFKSLNQIANEKNDLPFIVDSLFETKTQLEEYKDRPTETVIFSEMTANCKNIFIASMTTDDFNKIEVYIDKQNTNIFLDPIHNARKVKLLDFFTKTY